MARGSLRIYLGAAPGVGKTFAMLNEGRRGVERDKDVVVAFVETHGRARTAAEVAGLEVVPRLRIEHRGAWFEEFDVAAVLARRPEIALVDELAHTNVPGSRHEKRWQDVEQLLDAGIHVIGNYIFGLPEDDLASMQATLDLALELNCEMGNFYCAMAYPGSQLYREAERDGLPLPGTWSGYSQHAYHTLPLPTRHLPASEVLRFRDAAFKTYCSSPRYLAMVAEKFGQETADQILAATKIDLPRALLEAPQPVAAGESASS